MRIANFGWTKKQQKPTIIYLIGIQYLFRKIIKRSQRKKRYASDLNGQISNKYFAYLVL